jgi:hypothetical protein
MFSLSTDVPIFIVSCVGLIAWYYYFCRFLERGPAAITPSEKEKQRRSRSWYLTLPISLWFGYVLGPWYIVRMLTALSTGPLAVVEFLTTENVIARSSAICISAFFILDIVIGCIEYRDQLKLSTGYIHHFLYFFLYGTLLHMGGTQYTIAGAVCEAPTFIMALGTIFPAFRNDYAFGATFFFTRIAWFVLLFVVYSISAYNTFLPAYLFAPPLIAAIGMHIWWMMAWFKGMALRRSKITAKST